MAADKPAGAAFSDAPQPVLSGGPARRFRRLARTIVHEVLIRTVSTHPGRQVVNALYNRLSTPAHERLQQRFAKVFRERSSHQSALDSWTIRFGKRKIRLPLVPHRMWLDWDAALSTLGHEVQVKQTYATLLSGPEAPTLFIDVGANYGTHSLIFLVHGVRTLTFEPNGSCHEYFRESCALNGVSPQLEGVALGEAPGVAELCYPEGETWLGSIDQSTVGRLEHEKPLIRTQVPVRRLDDYIEGARGKRVFLKIDAEGHEVAILKGASRLLSEVRPWVLFESWATEPAKRRQIMAIFSANGYRLARLPLVPDAAPIYVTEDIFLPHPDGDFIAIPA